MTPRDRRALWIGVMCAGCWVAVRAGAQAARTLQESRVRATAAVAALEDAQAMLAGRTSNLDSLRAALEAYVATAPLLMHGATQAEAGAALAAHLTDVAGRAGLRVVRLESQPDSVRGSAFSRTAARLVVEGDVIGLTTALRMLAAGRPFASVREFAISAPAPASPRSRPERLVAELLVHGWFVEQRRGD